MGKIHVGPTSGPPGSHVGPGGMVLGGRRTGAQGSVVFLWGWRVGGALEGDLSGLGLLPLFPAFTTVHLLHMSLSLVPFCRVDPLTPVWHLSQEGFLQTK